MEQQFKKILEKSKAQKEQKDPLFTTFEGALFEQSAWFLQTEETDIAIEKTGAMASPVENTAKETPVSPAAKILTKESQHSYLSEVLFVGDTFNGVGDDLLGKMISAMKLNESEFYRYPLDEELENINDLAGNLEKPSLETKKLLDFIDLKRPKVVVSLGATITNILLGKREKLSTIHGQFIDKKHGECVFALMPIFHPEFLTINPNMKRTAWIDLQKVMERVGKI